MTDLPDSLPAGIRRTILRLAFRGMTIDQRRAAGILPGRLVLPAALEGTLAAAIKITQPVAVQLYAQDRARMVVYRPAAGEVVRIAPHHQQYAKTCRVLARQAPVDVYSAVLTGICSRSSYRWMTTRNCTAFYVIAKSTDG